MINHSIIPPECIPVHNHKGAKLDPGKSPPSLKSFLCIPVHIWEGAAQWCGTNLSGPDPASNQSAHTGEKVKSAWKFSPKPSGHSYLPPPPQTKVETAITLEKPNFVTAPAPQAPNLIGLWWPLSIVEAWLVPGSGSGPSNSRPPTKVVAASTEEEELTITSDTVLPPKTWARADYIGMLIHKGTENMQTA